MTLTPDQKKMLQEILDEANSGAPAGEEMGGEGEMDDMPAMRVAPDDSPKGMNMADEEMSGEEPSPMAEGAGVGDKAYNERKAMDTAARAGARTKHLRGAFQSAADSVGH